MVHAGGPSGEVLWCGNQILSNGPPPISSTLILAIIQPLADGVLNKPLWITRACGGLRAGVVRSTLAWQTRGEVWDSCVGAALRGRTKLLTVE
ncbi:hypothetical protein Aglo03_16670 [Actinokineospora globicatena]|uniref:Uncharacterized protein n=1 Tax=Actinokineospora globicatena TaxID=103729 RepID=A0A9W6QIT9_9PSEU|nr:hypothetical protein Aglo03_16670 [Actinokineospora globicatena]